MKPLAQIICRFSAARRVRAAVQYIIHQEIGKLDLSKTPVLDNSLTMSGIKYIALYDRFIQNSFFLGIVSGARG
jgi:hypothetical protein